MCYQQIVHGALVAGEPRAHGGIPVFVLSPRARGSADSMPRASPVQTSLRPQKLGALMAPSTRFRPCSRSGGRVPRAHHPHRTVCPPIFFSCPPRRSDRDLSDTLSISLAAHLPSSPRFRASTSRPGKSEAGCRLRIAWCSRRMRGVSRWCARIFWIRCSASASSRPRDLTSRHRG